MIRTLCRGTALYDDRRRTNLHHVGDSSKIQNELGKTVNSSKLDLGATAPPYDGNHSTCGYLGVIWTPWRDSNSQIGLIPLSLCRERRSKKVTHFRLYGNVRTWHGQIQELKGGFNRGYGGHWAADGKPNSPPSLPYTTATMRVHAGRDSAPEPKITIIPSFLLREWKLLLFCFRYYFFGS